MKSIIFSINLSFIDIIFLLNIIIKINFFVQLNIINELKHFLESYNIDILY